MVIRQFLSCHFFGIFRCQRLRTYGAAFSAVPWDWALRLMQEMWDEQLQVMIGENFLKKWRFRIQDGAPQ
jgi:hypothetical protein